MELGKRDGKRKKEKMESWEDGKMGENRIEIVRAVFKNLRIF